MPYYHFREQWTPLKWVGIKLFKDEEDQWWIKLWGNKRKRLFASRQSSA